MSSKFWLMSFLSFFSLLTPCAEDFHMGLVHVFLYNVSTECARQTEIFTHRHFTNSKCCIFSNQLLSQCLNIIFCSQ